jgi:putative spermidine/putrescine transport system ATP-binding protein
MRASGTRISSRVGCSSASRSPARSRSSLDEPLSALDAKVRVQLREEIRRIQLELGITTIYVTHDQEEALAISDRVAVLHDGRIDQVGTPVEMYGAPATPFVAEFIGTMNRLASTVVADGVVEYAGQRLHVDAARGLPNGERVLVLVRPETVSISPATDGQSPEGSFAGEVVSQIFLGSVTRLRMAGSSGEGELTADLPTTHAQAHAIGDRVTGSFPSSTGRLLSLAEQPEPVAVGPDDR